MKSTNQKSRKNTLSSILVLAVLSTTIGFAQTERKTQTSDLRATSELSSFGAHTNPYFTNNELAGEMLSTSDATTEPIQTTKQRTKSNNTNERTTRPNGQDDGNPFPPKSQSSKGKPQIASYDLKANKKV